MPNATEPDFLACMLLAVAIFVNHGGFAALHVCDDQHKPVIGADLQQVADGGVNEPKALECFSQILHAIGDHKLACHTPILGSAGELAQRGLQRIFGVVYYGVCWGIVWAVLHGIQVVEVLGYSVLSRPNLDNLKPTGLDGLTKIWLTKR